MARRSCLVALLLLLASPVHADDWPLHTALGAYMTLNGIDLAQTMVCIGASRCSEANPFMRPFADHPGTFGAIKIGVGSAVVYTILRVHDRHPRIAWALAGLGIAVETAATVHNARLIRSER